MKAEQTLATRPGYYCTERLVACDGKDEGFEDEGGGGRLCLCNVDTAPSIVGRYSLSYGAVIVSRLNW